VSTLLLQPPIIERAAPPGNRTALDRSSAPCSAAPPISQQLAQLFRRAGLARADVRLIASVYAFVVVLIIFATLASRFGHAAAFQWGAHLMNVPLAAIGLGALALSTAAVGTALYFAGRARNRAIIIGLGVAILGCLGFIATVAIDLDAKRYYGIRPAAAFKPNDRYVARQFGVKLPKRTPGKRAVTPGMLAAPVVSRTVDAPNGRKLFFGTCASCHGFGGEGLPGQGKTLVGNEFVGQRDDAAMLGFLKIGRPPWDPLNTTKVQMPPRGGNPRLNDDDLRDIVAHLRTLKPAAPIAASTAGVDSAGGAASAPTAVAGTAADASAGGSSLLLPGWIMPSPPPGPLGLADEFQREKARPEWKAPADGVAFANSFCRTMELGGIHAGLVTAALLVLLVQAVRGRISVERRAPLALGVIASAVLTASWCIIFPFVYLL
jgi:mono/diheme cytochrome c family protein/heme/copper-type cytochrome/quinol oxidase subunit 3